MRVGVEGRVFHGPPTGTAVYARGLVRALVKNPRVAAVAVATYAGDPRGGAPVDELIADRLAVRQLGPLRSRLPGLASRAGLPIPFDLLLPGADWYLYPNFRWQPVRAAKTMTVVHDLTALEHPWSVPGKYRRRVEGFTRQALRGSTVVVTPSESVAEEVRARVSVGGPKVVAVRPGADPDVAAVDAQASQRRGVLFVGTVQPRKNVGTLLAGYAGLPEDLRRRHPLTVLGQIGWEDPDVLRRMAGMEGVTVTGYVDRQALREAYDGAAVLVAPSWYEGFDLPVLEAMAAGIPVVASDIPVHREVAGTAGRYFTASEPSELTRELSLLLSDAGRWQEASGQAATLSRRFTWATSVERLICTLETSAVEP